VATDSFRIDPQDVIHETIDGEVIIIAVATGVYYSLEGSGAEVWAGLLGGRSARDIVGDLERRYDAPPGAIGKAVSELIEELVKERLVRQAVPPSSGNGSPSTVGDVDGGGGDTFAPPVLRKFTDMQDFLLVDPVHEVDDAGWPHPATFTR
jgi:hypothetical protein